MCFFWVFSLITFVHYYLTILAVQRAAWWLVGYGLAPLGHCMVFFWSLSGSNCLVYNRLIGLHADCVSHTVSLWIVVTLWHIESFPLYSRLFLLNRCQNYVHFLLYLGYYLMAKYDRSGMYGAVSSPYQESDRKICLNFWFNMYNVSLHYYLRKIKG